MTLPAGTLSAPSLLDPLVEPLADNDRVVELIAGITDQPEASVRRRLCQEELRLGTNVRAEMRRRGIVPYRWSDDLVEFYQDTDAFLYELVVHNRNAEKILMRHWIADFLERMSRSALDVLAFGDGLGIDSLFLSQRGQRVSYFEVAEKSRGFARAVFDGAGVSMPMLTDLDAIPAESYDAVLCLDVLEHVPDPPGLVAALARILRPGGVLIVSAPFFMVCSEFPTHLQSNRRYSGSIRRLYGAHGLELVDGRAFFNPIVLGKPPLRLTSGWRQAARRLRVRLGGLMLHLARVWSLPHIAVGRALQQRGQAQGSNDLEGQPALVPNS